MTDDPQYLQPRSANYVPLTPTVFLRRAAAVFPGKVAVVHGPRRITYAEFYERARRLASALMREGVQVGDAVVVMAPNTPALLEAHYGVPMAGGVLTAINTRLDVGTIAFILRHCEAKVLIADRDYAATLRQVLSGMEAPPRVVDVIDEAGIDGHPESMRIGDTDYESFLQRGDADLEWALPQDEWQSIALNYTSGTTGEPKGVLYHHRGAYLNAMGNALAFGLTPATVYLWTLPMFHCNGWTYTWAVTLAGGTHVCLRQVDPARIYELIAQERVTHLCGAPIVLNMLANSPSRPERPFDHGVQVATGGAAPPSVVIERMERLGMRVVHLYGLTETYGPASLCEWQPAWGQLDLEGRASRMARQGVAMPTQYDVTVVDTSTRKRVPRDGQTVGEIAIRGSTVMKGYLKNPGATQEAFAGGYFHSGDLAVLHPDGYVEIRDRLKDIVISGGENISTIEVEQVLYRHPWVLEAAVVAKRDEKWGETPCAFVTLKEGAPPITEQEIVQWCRGTMAAFKYPRAVVFSELPKTSTGKIQKFVLRQWANAEAPKR